MVAVGSIIGTATGPAQVVQVLPNHVQASDQSMSQVIAQRVGSGGASADKPASGYTGTDGIVLQLVPDAQETAGAGITTATPGTAVQAHQSTLDRSKTAAPASLVNLVG